MADQHPITPPPELIQQWVDSWYDAKVKHDELATFITTKAARWGADQELEACAKEVSHWSSRSLAERLRIARRPKPPSLKEQALSELNLTADSDGAELSRTQVDLIRCALEQLSE